MVYKITVICWIKVFKNNHRKLTFWKNNYHSSHKKKRITQNINVRKKKTIQQIFSVYVFTDKFFSFLHPYMFSNTTVTQKSILWHFKRQPHKMIKHFVGLALKVLTPGAHCCSLHWKLQVYLSIYDLLVDTRSLRFKVM